MPRDWSDVKAVMAYAMHLGPGLIVYRDKRRTTYGIAHASRYDEGSLPHLDKTWCIEIMRT